MHLPLSRIGLGFRRLWVHTPSNRTINMQFDVSVQWLQTRCGTPNKYLTILASGQVVPSKIRMFYIQGNSFEMWFIFLLRVFFYHPSLPFRNSLVSKSSRLLGARFSPMPYFLAVETSVFLHESFPCLLIQRVEAHSSYVLIPAFRLSFPIPLEP